MSLPLPLESSEMVAVVVVDVVDAVVVVEVVLVDVEVSVSDCPPSGSLQHSASYAQMSSPRAVEPRADNVMLRYAHEDPKPVHGRVAAAARGLRRRRGGARDHRRHESQLDVGFGQRGIRDLGLERDQPDEQHDPGGGTGGSGSETSSDGELEWGYTMSGGADAEASGVTLVLDVAAGGAMPGGTVTFNSASQSEDGGVEGQYRYFEDDAAVGDHMTLAFAVRLPGGMLCGNDVGAGVLMTVSVADGAMDSYDATFAGPVVCEDGTEATVEGFLRQL